MSPELIAKVKATNKANKYAVEMFAKLSEVFTPLVGCKVLKADGTLLKSVKDAMPKLLNEPFLSVYRYSSDYTLMWVVKASEMVEGASYCVYHETSVYIANLSGQVLKSMNENFTARSDYKPEEIVRLREVYTAAKQVADDAKSALHPFGENDR